MKGIFDDGKRIEERGWVKKAFQAEFPPEKKLREFSPDLTLLARGATRLKINGECGVGERSNNDWMESRVAPHAGEQHLPRETTDEGSSTIQSK